MFLLWATFWFERNFPISVKGSTRRPYYVYPDHSVVWCCSCLLLVRVGHENGHLYRLFKNDIQHGKWSAHKTIGRTGWKNVKKATTRFQVQVYSQESRSCCFLPLVPLNTSPRSGNSKALVPMAITAMWHLGRFSSVQLLSHVRLFVTPWTAPCQASLSITNSGVHPNPCPLSRWCHPTISFSVVPFSSCPQSFPVSGLFK